jgi:hypothetical protein
MVRGKGSEFHKIFLVLGPRLAYDVDFSSNLDLRILFFIAIALWSIVMGSTASPG